MVTQYARQAAVPCTIADIRSGAWLQNDGLVPSGVRTPYGTISRANIIGVIIEKNGDSFSMEDGTGTTQVRSFDAVPVHATVGDVVLVIGRPREYNGERYIVLEICKKLHNTMWVRYRKAELALRASGEQFVVPEPERPSPHVSATVQVTSSAKNPFETIIERLRELDTGNGVDVEELIAAVPNGENYVRTLLDEGEIFEIKPGKVKVLE